MLRPNWLPSSGLEVVDETAAFWRAATHCILKVHSLTYLLTYGAEPFLRNCQLCSHSRTSQRFMETERSLPCSQEHSTGPCFKGIKYLKALFLKYHDVIILLYVKQPNTAPTRQQNFHHTYNTCIHTSFTVRIFIYHIFGGTWVECEWQVKMSFERDEGWSGIFGPQVPHGRTLD
jgi:hypothetical protein